MMSTEDFKILVHQYIHGPIDFIFYLVAGFLKLISLIPYTTYQSWNIFLWFILLPTSWIFLISLKTSKYLNILSIPLLLWFLIDGRYNLWFDKSVFLLTSKATKLHISYIEASVYFCVFLPILIHLLLVKLFATQKTFKITCITLAVISISLALLYFIVVGSPPEPHPG